jgi:hypothetical protein
MEEVLGTIMFVVPSNEDVARVVVTRESVLENAAPTIVPRKAVRPTEKSAWPGLADTFVVSSAARFGILELPLVRDEAEFVLITPLADPGAPRIGIGVREMDRDHGGILRTVG